MNSVEANGFSSIKELIVEKGCYSPEENLRIYNKWFAEGPRYLFRAVDRKYGLTDRVLVDVGCAFGTNLLYCRPGSYGIDLDEYRLKFAQSVGLTVYQRDVVTDDLSDLPKAEAVWCSAVLEHVDSPHSFLRKLHGILQPGGLVCIYVPTIPIFPWLRHLPGLRNYCTGYLAADHINAYVPETLRFSCERAGFETLEVTPLYPGLLVILNIIPLGKRLIDGCVYVGKKIPDWEYHEKSTRRAADNVQGFVFVGESAPDDPSRDVHPGRA